ncbi:hypothetical protein [Methylomonas sp. 11b]|uniref:hypothetical protein n=1 Tax=Methylomonas sp. 11b TaxID=1168169 RepID=UPI0004796B7D|nr:hypothetical protein [Methylomonas sp. 11b]
MNNEQYEALAGRIDALAHFTLALAARLEMSDLMDGAVFTDQLRNTAQSRNIPDRPICTQASRAMLTELLDRLDDMRTFRQSAEQTD